MANILHATAPLMTGLFRAWHGWIAAAALLLPMAWAAGAGAGDSAPAIRDILQAVIRDADIQTLSPRSGEEPGRTAPAPPAAEPGPALVEPVRAAVLVAGLILLALLGLGSLLLIGRIAVTLVRRRRSRPAAAPLAPLADPAASRDAPDPDETERLARRGDFSGAIHLLLLRALGRIEPRLLRALPRALASREVLRR